MTAQTNRDPKPADMPWLTPYLTVRDVTAAMDFYEKAFGFEKGHSMTDDDGQVDHGEMRYKGQMVLMVGLEGKSGAEQSPAGSKSQSPISLYVYCDDVDAMFRRASDAGAVIVSEPAQMFWGDRVSELVDPDGYHWNFATNVADFEP